AIEHKSAQESGEEAQFLLVAHFKPDQIGGIAVHGLGDLHIWDSPELLICGLLINEIVQFFIEYPAAEQSYGAKIVFGKNIQVDRFYRHQVRVENFGLKIGRVEHGPLGKGLKIGP